YLETELTGRDKGRQCDQERRAHMDNANTFVLEEALERLDKRHHIVELAVATAYLGSREPGVIYIVYNLNRFSCQHTGGEPWARYSRNVNAMFFQRTKDTVSTNGVASSLIRNGSVCHTQNLFRFQVVCLRHMGW